MCCQGDVQCPILNSFNLLFAWRSYYHAIQDRHTQLWGARTQCTQIPSHWQVLQTISNDKACQVCSLPFILLTCKSQQRSDCTIRPRSLVSLITSSFLPAMYRSGRDGGTLLKQICITLHLDGLSLSWLQFAQASRSHTSRTIWDGLWAWWTSARLRSSTYLKLWVTDFSAASLMRAMKMIGPNLVPWGTPHVRSSQLNKAERYWTRWRLDVKKSAIHGIISLLTPRVQSFWMAKCSQHNQKPWRNPLALMSQLNLIYQYLYKIHQGALSNNGLQ